MLFGIKCCVVLIFLTTFYTSFVASFKTKKNILPRITNTHQHVNQKRRTYVPAFTNSSSPYANMYSNQTDDISTSQNDLVSPHSAYANESTHSTIGPDENPTEPLSNENASKRGGTGIHKEAFILSNPQPKFSGENIVNHFLERAHEKSEKFLPFRLVSNNEVNDIHENPSSVSDSPVPLVKLVRKNISTDGQSSTRELKLKEITPPTTTLTADNNSNKLEGVTMDSSESNAVVEGEAQSTNPNVQVSSYYADFNKQQQQLEKQKQQQEEEQQKSLQTTDQISLSDKVNLMKNRLDNTRASLNDLDKSGGIEATSAKPKYVLRRIDDTSTTPKASISQNEQSPTDDDGTESGKNAKITNIIENIFQDDKKSEKNPKNNKDDQDKEQVENEEKALSSKHKDSGLLIDKNSNFFVDNDILKNPDSDDTKSNVKLHDAAKAFTSNKNQYGSESSASKQKKHSSANDGESKEHSNTMDDNPKQTHAEKISQEKQSNIIKDQKVSFKDLEDKKSAQEQEQKPLNGKPPKPKPIDDDKPPQSSPKKRPTTMIEVNEHQQMTSTSYMDVKPVASFSYDTDSPYGPLSWHLLNPTWTCRSRKQSPINIETNLIMQNHLAKNVLMKVVPEGKPLTGTLKNNGHSPTFTLSPDSPTVRLFGATLNNDYFLKQFHFHFGCESTLGSEHRIDGIPFPLEMHLVFWDSSTYNSFPEAAKGDRGIAVVAVLFQISVSKIAEPSDTLPLSKLVTILRRIEEEGDGIIVPEEFDLRFESLLPSIQLMDKADRFYVYDGSLSTPGCYESVVWVVMGTHPTVTEEQLEVFRKLKSSKVSTSGKMCNNFRPVQKKYGRKIYSNII